MTTKDYKRVQSSTTRLYMIALFLVAMLSLTAYITIHQVISEHRFHGAVINVSGRQRMLSQRISVFTEALAQARSDERKAIESRLVEATELFEKSHHDLSTGSQELGQPIAKVHEVYFGSVEHLDQDTRDLISNVRKLLNAKEARGQDFAEALRSIREITRNQILPKLDLVVQLNQEESDKQVAKLEKIEAAILVSTLTLLLIEALFIFRPMIRRISELLKMAWESREAAIRATDAKSAFLATITHEIRNPLAGISIIAQFMVTEDLPDPIKRKMEMLDRLTKSLIHLVNDILDYSKIEAGKLSLENIDFNVSSMVKDTQTLFLPMAESKKINLSVELDSSLPAQLKGDPTRLRQVVTNFVGNAMKFTPEGGSIHVSFNQKGTQGSHIPFRVEVKDSGCGIPMDTQAQIFECYSQAEASTTRKYGGTGLGLAISKQIIDLMNGKIGFQSVENQGSTFWFEVSLQPTAQIGEMLGATSRPKKKATPAA